MRSNPGPIHKTQHPQADKEVILDDGSTYHIEDWWDRLVGRSWKTPQAIAEVNYFGEVAEKNLPSDDEVVYGKIGCFGYLKHISQIVKVVE